MSDFRPLIQANMLILGFRGNNEVVLSKNHDGTKYVAYAVDDIANDCIPLLKGPAEMSPFDAIEGLLGLTADMVRTAFDNKLESGPPPPPKCNLNTTPFVVVDN